MGFVVCEFEALYVDETAPISMSEQKSWSHVKPLHPVQKMFNHYNTGIVQIIVANQDPPLDISAVSGASSAINIQRLSQLNFQFKLNLFSGFQTHLPM